MSRLILGTAGHIDHGKTTLVRALTGTDTDRLKEEKARGITIELGFAELEVDDTHFGVVDVPGHEAFVRAMVAGAAGMDVVLLVVAADEGMMPQTREHLAIVELLGVPEVVVALTKSDLVDEEWLELVESDVREGLSATPYAEAPFVHTSGTTGEGLEALRKTLVAAGIRAERQRAGDVVRLPLDRVFTIQGTGTVVTGTLWSGALAKGDRVRILPQDLEARVRGLQVHGREVDTATAGDRTAVALTGDGADRDIVARGATLVTEKSWDPTWMLTVRARLLPDTAWSLEHNQRVRVHVGTAEVMARCALLEERALGAGDSGWVQLRLEEPVVARGGDRVVLRAYSPVTTIGGGEVAEADPPKRNRLSDDVRGTLAQLVEGDEMTRLQAALALASWAGTNGARLALATGIPGERVGVLLEDTAASGEDLAPLQAGDALFSPQIRVSAEKALARAVAAEHDRDPLKPAIALAAVRSALPVWSHRGLADAVLDRLIESGSLVRTGGGVRAADHVVSLTPDQERAAEALRALLKDGGLAAPLVEEYPEEFASRPDLWSLLKYLEEEGDATMVGDDYYVDRAVLEEAIQRVRETLGGQTGLGPADFREALPVTRKHLIPLLNHFDATGVTLRKDEGRDVAS